MIGRQRANFGRERAPPVSESWSACSLTGNPCARAAVEHASASAPRVKPIVSQNASTASARPRARGGGNDVAANVVDVVVGAAGELGRQRVRREQRRAHVDVELGAERARRRASCFISFAVSSP